MPRISAGAEWLIVAGASVSLAGVAVRLASGGVTLETTGAVDALLVVATVALFGGALALRRSTTAARAAAVAHRRLLEIACDAVVVIAPDRHIVQVTPRGAALFGYAPRELIGRPLSQLLSDWSPSPCDWPTAVKGTAGQGVAVEFNGHARDGSTLALEITTGPAAGPTVGGMALLIRDVTRARRMRDELRAKEAHLRLILEQMPAILWTTNTQLHITSTVGAGLAALDLKPADVIGMSMLETLGRSDPTCTPVSAHARALQGESLSHEMEWKGRTVQVRVEPLRNLERRITGTIGVVVDVTDRKEAEATEKRLVALLEATTDSVAIADADHRLLYVNRAGRTMLGLNAHDDLGAMCLAGFYPDELRLRFLNEIVPAALKKGAWSGELDLQSRTGQSWAVSQVVLAHRSPAGAVEFLSLVARDIGERLRLEEQLRQAQKMEAVGRLAGGIAHDFNNLLCIITGYSEMALGQLGPESALHMFLNEINKAGNRAATLTRQLLAFSRRSLLAPKVLDLNALIRDAGGMLRRMIDEDIELTTGLEADLPTVKADPNQLDQVLMNLVVNARDAMPQGGRLVLRTARAVLSEAAVRDQPEVRPGTYVVLSVSDTGCGMTDDVKRRIFEPFFTTKGVGKGTGLGLAMVYGIVKQSGGHIEVTSGVGHGSEFRIYLPCAEVPVAEPAAIEVAEVPAGTETILLAEDEEAVRSLVLQVLRRSGYAVLEARDGEEALALSTKHTGPIHLLLTDVVMPRLSGGRLARQLTRQRPEVRVLFMSGFADSTLARHDAISGDIDCVLKPFTPEDLARKVRETLDGVAVS
jgi:two-component system, cell cycle sensor histidine kinase and response regulator CckA